MYILLTICFILTTVTGIHEPDSWHPFRHSNFFQGVKTPIHSVPSSLNGILDSGYQSDDDFHPQDTCGVYKVAFTQNLHFQYIQYKTDIPDLKQFTLCYWSKFYNHSNDHPIFSYSVDGQPRAIYSWVSNSEQSSYFSLAVSGHTFYRLNYPLRLNRWYHTCQSWNGKTGEWQIWVNAERVGRGFHNRLVGHSVSGGGIVITGQEQRQIGEGVQHGLGALKGPAGLLGEVTMVQLYKVALTAGKAHKDHKHHHAHQFDHNGRVITTPAPTTPRNRPTLPSHPLLTGGQINPNIKINLAAQQVQQQPQVVQGQNFAVQYLNGQFVGSLVSQQLQNQNQNQNQQQNAQQNVLNQNSQSPVSLSSFGDGSYSSQYLSLGDNPVINNGLNHLQYSDNAPPVTIEVHNLFKRNNGEQTEDIKESEKSIKKRYSDSISQPESYLAGGSIFEESIGPDDSYTFDQSLLYGLAGIGKNEAITEKQKQTEDEREPAEAEVKAVLNVCNGCDEEPFDKALIFGWRTVPKKLYSGAYYTPAVLNCKAL